VCVCACMCVGGGGGMLLIRKGSPWDLFEVVIEMCDVVANQTLNRSDST